MSTLSESDRKIMRDRFKKGWKWFLSSFIWLGLLLLVLDIVSKNIVVAYRETIDGGSVVIIPGFLRIGYTINKNLVFGISTSNPTTDRILFIVFATAICGGLIFWLVKMWGKINKYYRACFMMVLAGAIGNLIDRIFFSPEYLRIGSRFYYNGVVDWIDFYGIWKFNFNIADSAVVVAAAMLIVYMIVEEIINYHKKVKDLPKEDNTKIVSKTELEKNKYLENKSESKEDKNE